MSSKWALSLGFPHQNPVYASPLTDTRYMPRPFHSFRFYHPNNIGWGVQNIKFLIMYFSPLRCYLVPPRPQLFSSTPYSQTPSLRSSLSDIDRHLKYHKVSCVHISIKFLPEKAFIGTLLDHVFVPDIWTTPSTFWKKKLSFTLRVILICGNKMPTRCNRGFYCKSYCLLNMFRAPLCPSSGTQEYYTVGCCVWYFVLWFFK